MKERDPLADLSSIRSMMERSTKFISLSGPSGILAGIYALIGAFFAYRMVYGAQGGLVLGETHLPDTAMWWPLFLIALAVLVLALLTGVGLTVKKAKKNGQVVWNAGSKGLLTGMLVPLITGGLFILVMVYHQQYIFIAPASLIFYGLALVAGGSYTIGEVKYLGMLEILLGLVSALLPGYGIVFWTIGFGILHIIYGTVMYFKYDK